VDKLVHVASDHQKGSAANAILNIQNPIVTLLASRAH
jgi:hypothetical protein